MSIGMTCVSTSVICVSVCLCVNRCDQCVSICGMCVHRRGICVKRCGLHVNSCSLFCSQIRSFLSTDVVCESKGWSSCLRVWSLCQKVWSVNPQLWYLCPQMWVFGVCPGVRCLCVSKGVDFVSIDVVCVNRCVWRRGQHHRGGDVLDGETTDVISGPTANEPCHR